MIDIIQHPLHGLQSIIIIHRFAEVIVYVVPQLFGVGMYPPSQVFILYGRALPWAEQKRPCVYVFKVAILPANKLIKMNYIHIFL